MASFKDARSKEWLLSLSIATIRRVKVLTEVDLTQPTLPRGDHKTLTKALSLDVLLFVDVLCAVCRPQFADGFTDDQFADQLGGPAIGEALRAFFEEWSLFFQNLGRPDLQAAVAKTVSMMDAVAAETIAQLDRIETTLVEKARESVRDAATKAIERASTILTESGG